MAVAMPVVVAVAVTAMSMALVRRLFRFGRYQSHGLFLVLLDRKEDLLAFLCMPVAMAMVVMPVAAAMVLVPVAVAVFIMVAMCVTMAIMLHHFHLPIRAHGRAASRMGTRTHNVLRAVMANVPHTACRPA